MFGIGLVLVKLLLKLGTFCHSEVSEITSSTSQHVLGWQINFGWQIKNSELKANTASKQDVALT